MYFIEGIQEQHFMQEYHAVVVQQEAVIAVLRAVRTSI